MIEQIKELFFAHDDGETLWYWAGHESRSVPSPKTPLEWAEWVAGALEEYKANA